MSIDKYWREFVTGRNHTLLVNVIQDGVASFFEFAKEIELYEGDPTERLIYRKAIASIDLSELKDFFRRDFTFKDFGDIRIIHFKREVTQQLGYQEYNTLKNEGSERIYMVERYDEFFRSAQALILIRDVNAHYHNEKNDLGWALLTAGHALNLIELSPVPLDPQQSKLINETLKGLLNQILDLQNYSEEQPEDQLELEEPVAGKGAVSDSLTLDFFEEKFQEISESLKDTINKSLEDINSSITSIPKLISNMGMKNDVQLDEEFDYDAIAEDLRLEEESAEQLYEDYETPSDRLSTNQAENELYILQRAFKKEFKCENWENIAQGPFKTTIINNQITTKEEWLEDIFINLRYLEYQEIMDSQINSELGKQYFSILKRIVWPK